MRKDTTRYACRRPRYDFAILAKENEFLWWRSRMPYGNPFISLRDFFKTTIPMDIWNHSVFWKYKNIFYPKIPLLDGLFSKYTLSITLLFLISLWLMWLLFYPFYSVEDCGSMGIRCFYLFLICSYALKGFLPEKTNMATASSSFLQRIVHRFLSIGSAQKFIQSHRRNRCSLETKWKEQRMPRSFPKYWWPPVKGVKECLPQRSTKLIVMNGFVKLISTLQREAFLLKFWQNFHIA